MAACGRSLHNVSQKFVALWKNGCIRTTKRGFSVTARRKADDSMLGFIGLGNMGNHMAKNLIKKGRKVVVYDVVKESLNDLKQSGAEVASNPAEVASNCSRIVTMLPASPHVQEVYTGSNGIFSTVQAGSMFIDSSTIDTSVAQEMAEVAKEHKCTFLDAPVSGGVNAARDGVLTFMVGGPEAAFKEAKSVLDLMGKNVVHCGSVGTGQAAKICNNMLLAISMIGVSETMNLGTRLGLDPKLLASILNMSSGRCWSCDTYNPYPGVIPGVPSSNNYEGGFGTALMTKDLGLAQNAATSTKSPIPLGALSHQIYRIMTNSGFDKKDFSSVLKYLQEEKS